MAEKKPVKSKVPPKVDLGDLTLQQAMDVANDVATGTDISKSKHKYTDAMKASYKRQQKWMDRVAGRDRPFIMWVPWESPDDDRFDTDKELETLARVEKKGKKPAKVKEGWALTSDLQREIQAGIRESLLREASEDDHYHGPWMGGSAKAGGHPAGGSTEAKFTKKDGSYVEDRVRDVHKPYYDAAFDGVEKDDGPQTIFFTGGGPASGKTTGVLYNPDAGVPGEAGGIPKVVDAKTDALIPGRRAVYVNADQAKDHIPEYQAAVKARSKSGAAYSHEESSHMSKTVLDKAVMEGHSVVFDSVSDNGAEKLHAKVQSLKAKGKAARGVEPRVHADYATIPRSAAHARNEVRYQRSGRYVPDDVVDAAYRGIPSTVQGAMRLDTFDSIRIWDTSGPKGSPPKLVASKVKGKAMVVHDQGGWDRFLQSGDL